MTSSSKWPKIFPPLTAQQEQIRNDFMKKWHQELARRYGIIEKFNHGYVIQHAPKYFLHTLEIGAGLGEHLKYENLTAEQKKNYVALELRENMAEHIRQHFPDIVTLVGNCESKLPFADNHFDRILAVHVLEHLPNLPMAIKEAHRLCHKKTGIFSVVIPCEGGFAYSLARRVSAQRIFEHAYKQPYQWYIEREHINKPKEILRELSVYFHIEQQSFFPIPLPFIFCNLCIGLTLRPK